MGTLQVHHLLPKKSFCFYSLHFLRPPSATQPLHLLSSIHRPRPRLSVGDLPRPPRDQPQSTAGAPMSENKQRSFFSDVLVKVFAEHFEKLHFFRRGSVCHLPCDHLEASHAGRSPFSQHCAEYPAPDRHIVMHCIP